jgi:hypothetical protein
MRVTFTLIEGVIMSIVSIRRDWGDGASIVRIVTTDTIGAASEDNYITAQAANILEANEGMFQWNTGQLNNGLSNSIDSVLVSAIDGNALFEINSTATSLIPTITFSPSQVGLTALAGGGQTGATPVRSGFNTFTTVATANDSAILPVDVLGKTVTVINTTATSMNVFPATGDTINDLSANTAIAVEAGATTQFFGVTTTNWRTK